MAKREKSLLSEFVQVEKRPRLVGGTSLLVFVVTGVIWLIDHLNNWPGGYLPWMLSLGFLLACIASFLRFKEMREERDQAISEIQTTFDDIQYRLGFHDLAAQMDEHLDQNEKLFDSYYRFTLQFKNGGDQVIEMNFDELSIVLERKGIFFTADPDEVFKSTGTHILPNEIVNFAYHYIRASTRPLMNGICNYSIRYRHPRAKSWFNLVGRFEILWDEGSDGTRVRTAAVGLPTHEIVTDN